MLKIVKKNSFRILKKVLAIVLILFTLNGTVSPIFAASGSGTWTRCAI